jgi:hypothetical protein
MFMRVNSKCAHQLRPPPSSSGASRSSHGRKFATVTAMNVITLFGVLSVTAMLVFYALEERDASWTLWFARACLASSSYGFHQGAWPFGIVEGIWTGVALRRWHAATRPSRSRRDAVPIACDMTAFSPEERKRYDLLRGTLMRAVTASTETSTGFILSVTDAVTPRDIAEWASLERRCCPFLDLALHLDHSGSTRIEMSGNSGTKEVLRAEILGLP